MLTRVLRPVAASTFRGRRGRLIVACLVALLTTSTILVATANPARADNLTPCTDILFLGARGSGEPGPGTPQWDQDPGHSAEDPSALGARVQSAYEKFLVSIDEKRSVTSRSVNFVAYSLTPKQPSTYFAGLTQGVEAALRDLAAAVDTCPAQRFIVGGYSQGAMVMHRVLLALQTSTDDQQVELLSRIDAAILLADGDKVPSDNVNYFGSAGRSSLGIGFQYPELSATAYRYFTPDVGRRVINVCERLDTVCDFKFFNAISGLGTHTSQYQSGPLVEAAASQAALLVRRTPLLTSVSLPAGITGTPYSTMLAADVSPGQTLEWSTSSATLPPGLTLETNGSVTGTPTRSGIFEVQLNVRSTGPLGTSEWASNVVALSITDQMNAPSWNSSTIAIPEGGLTNAHLAGADNNGNILAYQYYFDPEFEVGEPRLRLMTISIADESSSTSALPDTFYRCVGFAGVGSLVTTTDGALWAKDCENQIWRRPAASEPFALIIDDYNELSGFHADLMPGNNGTVWMTRQFDQVNIHPDGSYESVAVPQGAPYAQWSGDLHKLQSGDMAGLVDVSCESSGEICRSLGLIHPDSSTSLTPIDISDPNQRFNYIAQGPNDAIWLIATGPNFSTAAALLSGNSLAPLVDLGPIVSDFFASDQRGNLWHSTVRPAGIARLTTTSLERSDVNDLSGGLTSDPQTLIANSFGRIVGLRDGQPFIIVVDPQ